MRMSGSRLSLKLVRIAGTLLGEMGRTGSGALVRTITLGWGVGNQGCSSGPCPVSMLSVQTGMGSREGKFLHNSMEALVDRLRDCSDIDSCLQITRVK